ncbi:thiamine pyrophosphate-binding protein [Variovorax sp. YR216]|uniref:thiamine pyrophosphate-binding protein n=1 Tax=Variovorax sp. YR216 TaxID=1882828 RepID=UPI0008953E6A|nr:thiamine pyrophosphate-binding protein [Variovorax sp. YR216]SEB25972.1 acetolactate synthase-1/2/3 large subunit [Variovorax sp. YR216]
MAKLNGGQVLVEVLRRFGIDTAFTLHGGHLDAAYQAARDAGMRVIDTRHEQAAGFAASAYARSSGRVGLAMVTAGGGITNVVSPVANALADCVPMLIIGGAPALQDVDALPVNGGVDQMAVMRAITKWAVQVPHINRLADLLGQAIRKAGSGKPGPVYVEVPIDIMFGRIEEAEVRHLDGDVAPARPAPNAQAVDRIVEMLRGAERPVILAGGGTLYSGCAKELRAFAERSGIPVLTNGKSRGILPTDHPLWGRGYATLAPARGQGLVPDLLLVLGARFGIYTGGRRKSFLPPEAKIVQVDIEGGDIGRIREADLAVIADCGETLRALLQATERNPLPDTRDWATRLCAVGSASKQNFAAAAKSERGAVHPYRLALAVANAIPRDAVVCLDGGESHSWIDMTAHSDAPGRWLGHGYVGSMGEGLPLAVGAQVANPGRRVVCFTGDGSLGFNFAEFDTFVRHGLPVVVVVNNDQMWGMSAHGQDLMYGEGKRMVSELGRTRYDQAAAGFGCHAEFVEDVADLDAAIERALASNKPACVNVMTDPGVMHPITQRFVGRMAEQDASRNFVPYADDLEA